MRIGVMMFTTDKGMQPVEVAKEAEARGFDSLWFPEHSHIPVSRRPPWGGIENAPPLPEEYWRTHDQFLALTAAAAVTSTLKLGTGITLVAQRDPIWLAKEVATLDQLSNGRFLFGIGYGWNHEEMENHGVDVKRRREVVRETMLAMQVLWTQEVASFSGEFVRFEPNWQWPKPVQQPRPRVLLGGAPGPILFRHIAEYGDGWLPIGGAGLAAALEQLRAAFSAAGRDPASLHIVPMGVLPSAEKLDYYREHGVTESVLRVPSATRDVVMPVLDAFARDYL